MATYTISYLTGDGEDVEAVNVNYDIDEGQYRFVDQHGRHVAFIPGSNVLSIVATAWNADEEAVTKAVTD